MLLLLLLLSGQTARRGLYGDTVAVPLIEDGAMMKRRAHAWLHVCIYIYAHNSMTLQMTNLSSPEESIMFAFAHISVQNTRTPAERLRMKDNDCDNGPAAAVAVDSRLGLLLLSRVLLLLLPAA